MPELPEVETIVRGLAGRVTGLRISAIHLTRGDIIHGVPLPLCAALHNRAIRLVSRRAKQIHIHCGPAESPKHTKLRSPPAEQSPTAASWKLVVHLGMTGRLTAVPGLAPLEPHTHLRLTFHNSKLEMRFSDARRFGGIWLCPSPGPADVSLDGHWTGRPLPRAGAEPLNLSLHDLSQLLARRRQIKPLLLDQEPIGGIGNIYCDEILHRAGIHPLACSADLDPPALRRLHRAIGQVLNAAIEARGSSVSDYRDADNLPGGYQRRHRVYDRAGQPCRTCRTPVRRMVVAGRGTFFCSACQPST